MLLTSPAHLVADGIPTSDDVVVVDYRNALTTGTGICLHAPDLAAEHGADPSRSEHVAAGPLAATLRQLAASLPFATAPTEVCEVCASSDPLFQRTVEVVDRAGVCHATLGTARRAVAAALDDQAGWSTLARAVHAILGLARSWQVDPPDEHYADADQRALTGWVQAQVTMLWAQARDARDGLAHLASRWHLDGPGVRIGLEDVHLAWKDDSPLPVPVLAHGAGSILDGDLPTERDAVHRCLLRVPTSLLTVSDPDYGIVVTDEPVSDADVALLPLALTLWQPDSAGPMSDPGAAMHAARDLSEPSCR